MAHPVGPGWWPLCDAVLSLAKTHGIDGIRFKEKFGLLRTEFWHGSNDKLYAFAEALEKASGIICEECGIYGSRDPSESWIKTLCKRCRQLRNKQRRQA